MGNYCTKCGQELAEGTYACPKCGALASPATPKQKTLNPIKTRQSFTTFVSVLSITMLACFGIGLLFALITNMLNFIEIFQDDGFIDALVSVQLYYTIAIPLLGLISGFYLLVKYVDLKKNTAESQLELAGTAHTMGMIMVVVFAIGIVLTIIANLKIGVDIANDWGKDGWGYALTCARRYYHLGIPLLGMCIGLYLKAKAKFIKEPTEESNLKFANTTKTLSIAMLVLFGIGLLFTLVMNIIILKEHSGDYYKTYIPMSGIIFGLYLLLQSIALQKNIPQSKLVFAQISQISGIVITIICCIASLIAFFRNAFVGISYGFNNIFEYPSDLFHLGIPLLGLFFGLYLLMKYSTQKKMYTATGKIE